MFQQNVRRFATVGALALLFFMAGAGSVQARDLSSVRGPWGWFQEIWSQGASVVGSWYGAPAAFERNPRSTGGLQKVGPGVDPNGANNAGPVCLACSDEGLGVDPNGSK
jgi:hypothetical protein